MRWLLLVAALLTGCANSDSVNCGTRLCPSHTVCDNVHSLCVSSDQQTACSALVDGDQCHADDIDQNGVCDQGFCVEGCGDSVVQATSFADHVEECDDGNFQSHDGCSSTCSAETPVWLERIEQWRGRYGHATAYMTNLDKVVMLGGIDLISAFPEDQWERDSAGKWTRIAKSGLGQRNSPAMAFDAVRNVVVVFGGYGPSGLLGDTWEYDGTTWTKRTITGGPSPRGGAKMVWDSTRSKIVLFGGQTAPPTPNSSEVWEYNGTAWTPITTTGAIPARHLHAMAYDSVRQRIVVFGGITDTATTFDTWEYAPATATWTQNIVATHPSLRYYAAMTFQASRGKVVLFGGDRQVPNGVLTFGDHWEYDASGWAEATPPVRPPGRYGATLTAIGGGALLLVSGATSSDITPLPDAWELSSAAVWSDASPVFPPPREAPMAYDSKRGELTMFAGDFAVKRADTWAFDGNRWADITPTTPSPAWRMFHATAYDKKRDRIVVFGGTNGSLSTDETWEWDGEARVWSLYTGTSKPPQRGFGVLAYDDDAAVSVLFGGANTATLSDTWEFDGSMWTDRTSSAGSPPKAGGVTMAYDPDHKRIVAFDGDRKTFAYANHQWQLLAVDGEIPAPLPMFPTLLPSIAHDPERHVMTLYDGNTSRVWELADQTWSRVRVIGTVPPPRFNPAFTEHVRDRRLILFGGGAGGGVIGDTWYFGYRSETPDEDCTDGMDNDGDKHVDADDPDCAIQ